MPLPPRDALTAEQIDVIRAWIAAGAPSDAPPVDSGAEGGGPDAADASEPDGGEGGRRAGCWHRCRAGRRRARLRVLGSFALRGGAQLFR
jgi:hypothetical protein